MATVKKGYLTNAREWWRHLRRTKRAFWKGERQAGKREAEAQVRDDKAHSTAFAEFKLSISDER